MTKALTYKTLIRIICLISTGLNLLLGIILITPLTEKLCKPLIVDEQPIQSDVIIVLSAGAYKIGLPDFATMVRLKKGLELYSKGFANNIICAGGVKYDKINKTIADIMRDTLILYNVPPAIFMSKTKQ